jgi:hypothetical protein
VRYESLIGTGFDRWSEGQYSPGQIEAFNDFENSFILLSGAYRSGKSEIGARAAIRHAMFFPNSKVGIFRAHLASLRRSTLPTVLELIHPTWVKSWSNTYLVLELKNGSVISFIGCDSPDKLGSIELTFAFIDESSEVSDESLGMIQGRLSGQLKLPPNFDELPLNIQTYLKSTIDKRQVYLATNPKSTGHYLYSRFIDKPQPSHISYTSNSISNPNLPEVYLVNNLSAYVKPGYSRKWILEQIRAIRRGEKDNDGLFLKDALTPFGQRNLLGLWVALEGAIYDLAEEYHVVNAVPTQWGQCLGRYAGVDYGFHNPRVAVFDHYQFVVGDQQLDGYLFTYGWHQKDATGDDLVIELKTLKEEKGVLKAYFPHDQPGILKTAKKTLGSGFCKRAKTNVTAGINVTSRFINSQRLLFLRQAKDFELAWAEMTGYQWKENKEGGYKDEPVKVDDHYPDTTRYLVYSRHFKSEAKVVKGQPEIISSPSQIINTATIG